jgi:hypothetical protein
LMVPRPRLAAISILLGKVFPQMPQFCKGLQFCGLALIL